MANTPVEVIYTALKTQYEPATYPVRYPYVYDFAQAPYIYMYESNDTRIKGGLCDDRGGESRITVGIIEKDFATCVDALETLITFVKGLNAIYGDITVWGINALDVRDLTSLEQSGDHVFRREVDVIIRWGTT